MDGSGLFEYITRAAVQNSAAANCTQMAMMNIAQLETKYLKLQSGTVFIELKSDFAI